MFSSKRFAELAKSKFAFPRLNSDIGFSAFSRSSATCKGHFVVYITDGERFLVPLTYLNSPVFRELLKMSEQEFGLPADGPIILPCDSVFMDNLKSFVQGNTSSNMEKILLISIAPGYCSRLCSLVQNQSCQELPLHGC